jgi:hypothetical protein
MKNFSMKGEGVFFASEHGKKQAGFIMPEQFFQ